MNKKFIWFIVVAMSMAVIGVVWLEMDLIRDLRQENAEQFDNDVYDALNDIVVRLEEKEKIEMKSSTINGYQRRFMMEKYLNNLPLTGSYTIELDVGSTRLQSFNIKSRQLLEQFILNSDAFYNIGGLGRPLEERIKPDDLNALLETALKNRGISPDESKYKYNYGVYSKEKNSFVIIDGHYVVEESGPREVLTDYRDKNLYNPDFAVNLFPLDGDTPGELRLYFPNRGNIIWSSLWKNFFGLLFFTAVILFSFFYTLNVVFRQKKVSEMKTDFINNMTHEFKTPIATISLAADSMVSPIISGNPDKVKRFAGIIKQENIRMNSQVEKVLQMALLDKRDFSLKLTEVNLHEIIDHAVENINLQVEKKEGTATAVMKANKPIVQGDQTHISNVINNLLDNANKYSPEKPEISVLTRNVPNGVEVTIKDKGLGMSKEARKHIFDKFYRVHTGNVHDIKGFGLGLSYVKAIVTAHKGQISVKSELGKGSSFILFFPYQVSA